MNDSPPAVPFLDLQAQYAAIRDEVLQVVQDVIDKQSFVLGDEVAALEREVAAETGSAYAIGCASGTDALLLSLKALDIGPEDEVLVPVFTFFSTAGAVCSAGAKPVFVDIEPEGLGMDPSKAEARLSPWTRAIIPVHLFGQCADMESLLTLARDYGLKIIEDAAQAIGAKYRDKVAGTLGDTGALSFYPTKNLGGYGDGGMILTQDEQRAAKLKMLRVHGDAGGYDHRLVGTNSRLDALQAAILRVKLRHLAQWTALRRQKAHTYRELLADSPVELPVERPERYHVYNLFVIRAPRRDALREYLGKRGIGCNVYYPKPLHLQECFK
ncbi:MAG TPA: DegT/DnrJ/EryC1/StrS family aminotransferase, partial [Firmicutes bacterium]|nr:DegT/DnrJ/EryC1/StrS family aminotransferase [Bacillota bacterium]